MHILIFFFSKTSLLTFLCAFVLVNYLNFYFVIFFQIYFIPVLILSNYFAWKAWKQEDLQCISADFRMITKLLPTLPTSCWLTSLFSTIWSDYTACCSLKTYEITSCGARLKSNQKAVSYPITVMPILYQWENLACDVGIM